MITFIYATWAIHKIPDTVEPSTVWYIGGVTLLADAFLCSMIYGLIAWTF
jgi:hypothetical protein